ncbi:hypothetical protein IWW55_003365 [Coemansia sp. RSA 2706]|nr:hypothetical protein IWW55_003365 [Coemansia sp. RSA 2706]KAJ2367815.1 hypothetical protein H4S01_001944 [Coemansia sp. RSA 2610]
MRTYSDQDVQLMRQAIEQGAKCTSVDTAYNVGALITDQNGTVLSTGYSRQLPGNTHAEQCALQAIDPETDLTGTIMYTTMEPCSKRLSGNLPCVQRILNAGIKKVFVGVCEPPNFVQCTGVSELKQHGVEVVHVDEVEEECQKLNRHLHRAQ